MTAPRSLVPLLQEQIHQVDRRVRQGAYRHEGVEIRRAVAAVDRVCARLGLGALVRDLHPGTGKPQVLLEFRDVEGHAVVLKVYGRRRPNEAAVQALWSQAGVATAPILDAADNPVSWLLMSKMRGTTPQMDEGLSLTPALARVMTAAHQVYRADVGEPRPLYAGVGEHLRIVVAAAADHGYALPPDVLSIAAEEMARGRPTFLHGDLAVVNLLCDDGAPSIIDTCGYTGPAEFDAARWSARVGGSANAERALATWLDVETDLDAELARRLLGLELFMEAGVREIVKDEQGRGATERDPETLALIATARRLVCP